VTHRQRTHDASLKVVTMLRPYFTSTAAARASLNASHLKSFLTTHRRIPHMALKKRTSKIFDEADIRANSMHSIDPALSLGSSLSLDKFK
jgi:hypothetical protein